MIFQEYDRRLQSDLSDNETINQAHNMKERYDFISRAVQYVNQFIKLTSKKHFIILEKYDDQYDLPDDFIKENSVKDMYNQLYLKSATINNEMLKMIDRPSLYEIQENGPVRKISFDYMIDYDSVTFPLCSAYNVGDAYMYVYDASEAFENWWNGTIVRFNSNNQLLRVTYIEDVQNFPGASTITTSGVDLTLDSGTFGGMLEDGDSIIADGQTIEITAVGVGDAAATLDSAFTSDLSGASWVIVPVSKTLKKLYISGNTMNEVQDTAQAIDNTVSIVDIVMDYCYQPSNAWAEGPGTISGASTTITSTTAHGLKIGDKVICFTNDVLQGEVREVLTVPSTTTFTVATAFSADPGGAEYFILYANDTPPLPMNVSEYILESAVIFALKNEQRLQEANMAENILSQKLTYLRNEEFRELLDRMNSNVNEFDMIGNDWQENEQL